MCLLVILSGCAGGPPHDYYNPATVGSHFNGPITITLVDDVKSETQTLTDSGYVLIGTADYGGDQPKRVELEAQAKRVHANHVIYSLRGVPGQPGSWSFSFGRGFGSGGTDTGHYDVHVVFLGRDR
jgi:hypothetical protein